MAESIQAVHVSFSATTKQLRAETARAEGAIKRFGLRTRSNLRAASSGTKSLGVSFRGLRTAIATVGLGLFVRDLVRVGVEAEKASGVIAGLGKDVRENIGAINESARKLVLKYGATLADVQAAQFDYISATQDVVGSNEAVAESLKLAIAGGSTAATTMDALTSIIGAYSLAGSDAAAVSESLFRAQQRGKVTMEQLSASIVNVAASAAAAGVSYREMLGALASVTSGGLGGEATRIAATSTARLFDAISKASPKIIKESREMARAAGVLDFEFSKAQLATDGLAVFLQKLSLVVDGDLLKLTKLGVQAKAAKGALTLLKDEAKATAANLDDQARAGDELGDAMGVMSETTGQALAKLRGATEVFKVELLEGLIEPWREGLQGVGTDFDDVRDAARQVAAAVGVIATAAELVLDGWQVMVTGMLAGMFKLRHEWNKTFGPDNAGMRVANDIIGQQLEVFESAFADEVEDFEEDMVRLGKLLDKLLGEEVPKAGEAAEEAVDGVVERATEGTFAISQLLDTVEKLGAEQRAVEQANADAFDPNAYLKAIDEMRALDEERDALAREMASSELSFDDLFGLKPDDESDFAGGFGDRMREIHDDLLTISEQGAEVASSLADSFADAFSSFATGALSASEAMSAFARGFISDVARMISQQLALNLISGFFGSVGLTSMVPSLAGVSAPSLSSGPGKMATAGGGSTVNIVNNTSAEIKASTSVGPSGPQIDVLVQQVVAGDLERGGPISRTLDRTRGTSRRGRRG